MIIKRTPAAYRPRSAAWVSDYHGEMHGFADQVFEADLPTHSEVLGPDGLSLEYEPRRMGFDLTRA